ncbi:hypothetical protein AC249_AIPGENE7801, partial [Exaiptasia diaphana]
DTRFWLESKNEPRFEWTGHERDPHGLTDYMLARTCMYPFFVFGAVDPARDSWNLYAYVRNNPINLVDPDGRLTLELQDVREGASFIISFVPVVGDYKDLQEAVTGLDLISGEELTTGEQILAGVAVLVPVVSAALIRKGAKAIGEAADSGVARTYQTYTKTNPATGQVYSGRTSGYSSPAVNVAKRDASHPLNKEGFNPAVLDRSSLNPGAIRGREQLLIEANGGARSMGGTSANKINGIGPRNPRAQEYLDAARREF